MKRRLLLIVLLLGLSVGLVKNLQWMVGVVKATTLGWVNSGDNVYFTDGNVGIGTENPEALLDIQGNTGIGSIYNPQLISEITDNVGGFDRLSKMRDFFISGNYAYILGSGEDSLNIVDISNPANPILKSSVYDGDGEFNKLDNGTSVFVSGNYAYVTSLEHALTIIDISDPTDPDMVYEAYYGDGEYNSLREPFQVVVNDGYAYVVGDFGFTIIDVSDPTDPDMISETHGTIYNYFRQLRAVQVKGDYAYILGYSESIPYKVGITVLNISNKSNPQIVEEIYDGDGEFSKLGYGTSMYISGDYLYVASSSPNHAITIIDISNPLDLELVTEIYDGDGEFNRLGGVEDIVVSGNYLYATSAADNSLTIIDVSNPADPALVSEIYDGDGQFSKLAYPEAVFVSGNYVYIAARNDHTFVTARIGGPEVFNVFNDGKVGVGTGTPQATLDVNGFMKLKKNTSAPATCNADTDGSIAVSSGYRTCICKNGTGWVYTSDGSTSCSW